MRQLLALLSAISSGLAAGTHNVRDYGAVGDGTTMDTAAIQRAVDACAEAGGGTVLLPEGRYLSGSLVLRSNVALSIAPKATLLGSREVKDFAGPLVGATDATGVVIEGGGTINGQGDAYWEKQRDYSGPPWRGTVQHEYKALRRPSFVRFTRCKDVNVRDVSLVGSPSWTLHLQRCHGALVENVTIRNPLHGPNTDGIDINSCSDVTVRRCDIITGDDGIVLKSTEPGRDHPSHRITIEDCRIWSACNALKIGTETHSDFVDIAMRRCHLYSDTKVVRERAISGIAIESVDGANLRNILVEDITMENVRTPIFVRLGHRGGNSPRTRQVEPRVPGTISGVTIRNVRADRSLFESSITGIPGHPVRRIVLEDIRLEYEGGGGADLIIDDVPDEAVIHRYPEASMFGRLPAYGLYCRHVEDMILKDLTMSCLAPDARPMLVCDNVSRATLDAVNATQAPPQAPLLWLIGVRDVVLRNCTPPPGTGVFVAMEGAESSAVNLVECDTRHARNEIALLPPGGLLSQNLPLVREASPGLVLIDPGTMRLSPPMQLAGGAIGTPVGQGRDMGTARCRFVLATAGDYTIRTEVFAPSAEADSFYASVDRKPALLTDVARRGEWFWDSVRDREDGKTDLGATAVLPLAEGEHCLVIRNREPGTRIRRIAIVRSDLPFPPAGLPR